MARLGTTWHDRFGTPVSHGCVNLSLADARWLFDWAPPALPPEWHAVLSDGSGTMPLWVYVTSDSGAYDALQSPKPQQLRVGSPAVAARPGQ
jgi:hypothetical protein